MQEFPDVGTHVPEISAVELKTRIDAGESVTVLDTRRPSNFETIIATNLGRETLSEDDAFEAELGPNNCAASAD